MNVPQALVDARLGGTVAGSYVTPAPAEIAAIEQALHAVVSGDEAAARGHARAAGFELIDVPEWPGTVMVRELPARRRGGGAYVVRRGSRSTLVVQAPHTFFDEGTLPLACAFFQHADARALFINTVHRYKAARSGESADVAHVESSSFQGATRGVVRALGAPVVVQLHGFGGRESAMKAVVSSGESARRPHVERVAPALDLALGGGVLRYPAETRELGATTNVQGKLVRAAGGTFLHVEMSEVARRLVASDPTTREAAFVALAKAVEAP